MSDNTANPLKLADTNISSIPNGELDPAIWGKYYPEQYASYLRNTETTQGNSKYRGSIPFSYLDKDPVLKRLFAGMSFSVEYNNKRGHLYALEDVQKTKRISPKTTASCWTCKSPNAPELINEMGDSFYKQSFTTIQPQIKHAVACADCHDSTMQLKVSRQPFREALAAMGKDPDKLTQAELRSAVCGQCHASYYLNSETKKVVFPWKFGLKPDDLEKYYKSTRFTEWSHPEDYAPLIKARHPEYETWSTSIHAQNNVSCPDCHMPKEQANGITISSHHWQSPMNTIETSCGKCHQDTTENLKTKVITVQDQVYTKKQTAEKAISDAIDAIVRANKVPNSDNYAIMMARAMHRRAQWRWDFVASENSMGFHNPEQALKVLDEAIKCSKDAQQYAGDSVKYPASSPQDKTPPAYFNYGGQGSVYVY